MAQIKNAPLGLISGKVGKDTCYIRDGKNYLAQRPEHYNIVSPKLIKTQGKFGAINRFTSKLYEEPLIAEIWKKAAPRKSQSYKFLVSLNSEHFLGNRPCLLNPITPPGNENPISGLCYESGKVHVKLHTQASGKIILFIVPINPVSEGLPEFQPIKPTVGDITGLEFNVDIHISYVSKIEKYSDYIIYGAVVNDNSWTYTVAFKGKV